MVNELHDLGRILGVLDESKWPESEVGVKHLCSPHLIAVHGENAQPVNLDVPELVTADNGNALNTNKSVGAVAGEPAETHNNLTLIIAHLGPSGWF